MTKYTASIKSHYQKSLKRLAKIRRMGQNKDKRVVAFYEEDEMPKQHALVPGYFYILAYDVKNNGQNS